MNQKRLKIAKCLIPIALVCVLPLWYRLMKGLEITPVYYVLCAIGAIAFFADRILKPWDMERAQQTWDQTLEQEERRKLKNKENND